MSRRTVSKVVSVKRRWRGRALPSAPPPERGSRATKDQSRGLSRSRIRGHRPLRQSQRGSFVTETHTDEREISNEVRIFRLFFEEGFQFAARLSPTRLGGGMVAGDFLRPA